MEWIGIPIDMPTLELLRSQWTAMQDTLIARVDAHYGIYVLRQIQPGAVCAVPCHSRIPRPVTAYGQLATDHDTFRDMALAYPVLQPLKELRATIDQLPVEALTVGADGRNRVLWLPFGATSGRNTPSTTRGVFGPALWIRHLIRPDPGLGVAYVDWAHQEFGIAAALSQDPAMLAAYASGGSLPQFCQASRSHPPGRQQGHARCHP